MINSKSDYLFYLKEDRKACLGEVSQFKYYAKWIFNSDDVRAYRLCRALRKYEYALNCCSNNAYYKIYKVWCRYHFVKFCRKCNVFIVPNTVGYGLQILHLSGGGCVIVANRIGNYFSVRQFTTIGKANGDACPTIGNNVTLGANVTIIGDVKIGDNCIIGAGAVVVKDVPADSIVVGNPGKVISKRIKNKQY